MDQTGFPYVCYYRELDNGFNSTVPWHWHKSVEIDYIVEGSLVLVTSDQTLTLHQGDICFINSGVLHTLHTAPSSETCNFYAHLFHASLLYGTHNSRIDQKYFQPILKNRDIDLYPFPADTKMNAAMVPVYLKIVTLDQEKPSGYEFDIREALSRLWFNLYQQTAPLHDSANRKSHTDTLRIMEMLQYIHDHFEEPISLADIAAVSGVSRQECMRCFQKNIHTSPIAYLTEYRVRIACELLHDTEESIITISEKCGFSSHSYFSKVFHNIMGCTPREYRHIQQ